MADLSGQTVKGYELHELIGAGGFGAVYRAHQPILRRDVALKIILPEYANHPEFIRRFEFEAQLVARLEHIHIVSLYDYWREPNGAFLVMRWLRGGSLRDRLQEGAVPTEDAIHIVEQVASALAAAHRRGVVHRDIKPDNILFDEESNAYLADFGIAKDLRLSADDDEFDGSLTGSPFYLSPEQAQAQPVTPQTDIYSLGIVIYEMLAGQPPFSAEENLVALLLRHINDPLPPLNNLRPDLPPEVEDVLQRATAKDPADRYADALALAKAFRRALKGTEEDAERQQAAEQTATVDGLLVLTKPLSASTLIIVGEEEIANPYKGLQPFEEADAEDFFGRAKLIDRLLDRMREADDALGRFLAVIGPSGSGKSSVVKAGVVPALRRGALAGSERWFMVEMVPGADPFGELASALLAVATAPPEDLQARLRADARGLVDVVNEILPDDDAELVLVIDQFEEIFTLTEDEAARAHFLDLLHTAVTAPDSRLRVLVTMRADFYDRPLLYPQFGELVRKRNEVVLPLSTDEMREAIIGPAERVGVTVETGLVAAIVADIAEQPGALPLMQYALTEVFERRRGNVLTLEAYRESGGVLGALARRAEEVYQVANPAAREAMRQLFLRLVTLREGAEDTRRRVLLTELLSLAEDEAVIHDVLETLGKYRLLTFDHDPETRTPTVAVAHEALIREWARLRAWLDDNREDILLQRRLAGACNEWMQQGRDPSFLATGMRLQQFEQLAERGTIALTEDEREYVRASVAERERREAEERARAEREALLERRSRQRLRALLVVMTAAALVAGALALLANTERKNADRQRRIAERSAEVSHSLALAANAQTEMLVNENKDLAIALGLAANAIPDPPSEAQFILAQAAYAPGTRHLFTAHDTLVISVDYSADGTLAVAGDFDGKLILWDMQSYEPLRTFGPDDPDTDALEGHQRFVRIVRFAPDGQHILSGGRDSRMILWDAQTGEIVRTFGPDDPDTEAIEGHEDGVAVRDLAFNPADPNQVLTAGDDWRLLLWNVTTGEVLRVYGPDDPETETVEGHSERIREVAFTPDGTRAVSASYDGTLILWDIETGEVLRVFEGHEGKVASVAVSADGRYILSGGQDQTARLWDIETGEELLQLQGHGNWVKTVAFSADGQRALTSSDDATVRLWDLETGEELLRFSGHTDFVEEATFNPVGTQILSASGDGTLRLWDIYNGAEVRRLCGHTAGVVDVAVSADGQTALTAEFDHLIRIWDVATGEQIGVFDKHTAFPTVLALSPDGRYALSGDASGTDYESTEDDVLWLWDVATGEIVQRFTGHADWVQAAAFSPDGQTLVTGGKDTWIIVWDVETGEMLHRIEEFDDWVDALAFNADGSLLLAGGDVQDPRIVLFDAQTWQPLQSYEGHDGAVEVVQFAPDGRRFLSGSGDSLVLVWDVETGEVVARLAGHTAPITGAGFTPDGAYVVSASEDGTVRTWEVAGARLVRQNDVDSPVWALALLPDGRTALTGAQDKTARLWDVTLLDLEELIAWTRANRYVPELTCEQRAAFRVEPLCPSGEQ